MSNRIWQWENYQVREGKNVSGGIFERSVLSFLLRSVTRLTILRRIQDAAESRTHRQWWRKHLPPRAFLFISFSIFRRSISESPAKRVKKNCFDDRWPTARTWKIEDIVETRIYALLVSLYADDIWRFERKQKKNAGMFTLALSKL